MLCKDITLQAMVVGRLGRHWAPSALLQHHLQTEEQWHIPLVSSSPASQTQELNAKAAPLGAHAVCCRILCWGGDTLGTPRCHRCATQTAARSAPELWQQVLASHTSSGDGCSVANGDGLLSAGCKQELFFPATSWGSPAPCSKVLHGMQLSPSHCGPRNTDVLPAALCSSHHLVTASAWLGALQTPCPVGGAGRAHLGVLLWTPPIALPSTTAALWPRPQHHASMTGGTPCLSLGLWGTSGLGRQCLLCRECWGSHHISSTSVITRQG